MGAHRTVGSLARGLGLAALFALLTLALLEGFLRIVAATGGTVLSLEITHAERTRTALRRLEPALAEPHPDRIFELKTRAHQVFRGDEFTITMDINSRRLRDREHAVGKRPGTYRIVTLGDSFTFGWGVDVGETWWAELERHMAQRLSPTPVEVINLGVYMYTFDQQVQRLEEFGLAYEPDLIVADFYYPHLVTIATHTHERQQTKPWPRIVDSTLYVDDEGLLRFGQPLPFEAIRRKSVLADFMLSRLRSIQYRHSTAGRLNEYELLKQSRDPEFRYAWRLTRSAYERLLALAERRRIPVVVFLIPRDMQVWPAWKNEAAALSGQAPFESRWPQERFGALCRDLRMHCVDLLPRFAAAAAAASQRPLYYGVDVHWTPAGHALAGRAVYEFIVGRKLAERLR